MNRYQQYEIGLAEHPIAVAAGKSSPKTHPALVLTAAAGLLAEVNRQWVGDSVVQFL